MTPKTDKQLALELLDQLIGIEQNFDVEMAKLKHRLGEGGNLEGKSLMRYHLELLGELIHKL